MRSFRKGTNAREREMIVFPRDRNKITHVPSEALYLSVIDEHFSAYRLPCKGRPCLPLLKYISWPSYITLDNTIFSMGLFLILFLRGIVIFEIVSQFQQHHIEMATVLLRGYSVVCYSHNLNALVTDWPTCVMISWALLETGAWMMV